MILLNNFSIEIRKYFTVKLKALIYIYNTSNNQRKKCHKYYKR